MGDTGIGEGIEHFARLVETTKSLKTFDLSHNFLADKAATTLGNALMINRSITHLILKRNKITSDGLQLLSACLVSNIFITSLDVGGNLIGDSGFMKVRRHEERSDDATMRRCENVIFVRNPAFASRSSINVDAAFVATHF